jgi:hypothetical protein
MGRWHAGRHEDLGDLVWRLESHRVAEFESSLASPLRCQAGRPQCGRCDPGGGRLRW